MVKDTKTEKRLRRHNRIRQRVMGESSRPRLAIFRSAKHISAQCIDDDAGKTLLAVYDMQIKPAQIKSKEKIGRKVAIATAVGAFLAEQAKAKGITKVVFDRAGYRYHGRVKALAEAARAGGLIF
jgi:large subunit ribosomal protein L18